VGKELYSSSSLIYHANKKIRSKKTKLPRLHRMGTQPPNQ